MLWARELLAFFHFFLMHNLSQHAHTDSVDVIEGLGPIVESVRRVNELLANTGNDKSLMPWSDRPFKRPAASSSPRQSCSCFGSNDTFCQVVAIIIRISDSKPSLAVMKASCSSSHLYSLIDGFSHDIIYKRPAGKVLSYCAQPVILQHQPLLASGQY